MITAVYTLLDRRVDGRERVVGEFVNADDALAACSALRAAGDTSARIEALEAHDPLIVEGRE